MYWTTVNHITEHHHFDNCNIYAVKGEIEYYLTSYINTNIAVLKLLIETYMFTLDTSIQLIFKLNGNQLST